jgi:DNA topoisomerase VI subunit B
MAERETPAGGSIVPDMAKLLPAELIELGQKQIAATLEVQKEISNAVEQAGRSWTDRLKIEAELASELTAKLASSKSVPEAAQIYQEWMGRRMKLVFDDGQRLMADSQKLMSSFTRALSNGARGGRT